MSEAPAPAISVVMSVYNGERYVAEAVESVLGQTFADFEFILMDDGSTDGSPALLKQYAQRDPRVRLVSRPNRGLTKTLNEGLGLARGQFVARMDADDVSLPSRFEKQIAFLRAHPDCVCVGTRVLRIDPHGSPLSESDHKLTHEEIDRQLMEEGLGWAITHPAAMMRGDAVMRIGGYREQFRTSQDLDLWLRLAEVGRLANLPDVLLKYRYHPQSVGFTKFEEQRRVKAVILQDAYARRGRTPPAQWPEGIFTPLPVAEQLRRWARTALKANNRAVAKKHAIDALKREPLTLDSWRVAFRAFMLG
ncbi:MAG TPA: glycosyltransferase [Tepidisphaeraceae bacterium]|nr:glycosyltransferase [Tepidisphaeraceae bacterium]